MNWLGELSQKHINKNDTVLDLGCGVMSATMESFWNSGMPRIVAKFVLGVDIYEKYLKAINYLEGVFLIKHDITDMSIFIDKSFDVVLALDILEHLERKDAFKVIKEMERVARKKIIVYTPAVFDDNVRNVDNVYGLGKNKYQEHLCLLNRKYFLQRGYEVTMVEDGNSIFAVKTMEYKPPKRVKMKLG
jgi:ubiquinone/menaquinone biosynthesis C-methylase UbiE